MSDLPPDSEPGDYLDVNVDEAVMQAVLGPERNSSRNTPPAEAGPGGPTRDATPCQDGRTAC
jgi:hypothetical protein